MGTFETIVAALLAVGVIFLFGPGIKATLQKSREAPKDWAGALIPIGLVVLFVLFLIQMVRG